MDILKKSIAPITEAAWKEITGEAARILKINLTAREFVDIEGPTGLKQGGISTGRLTNLNNQSKEGINYGLREILPFVEIRKPFELNVWELDNANRGAKDIDLEPLEKAAKEIALFEENAIYTGFKEGRIKGLEKSAASKQTVLPEDPNEFLKLMGAQKIKMQNDGVEGPYSLVINGNMWQELINLAKGYPVLKQLQEIIEGRIILNHSNHNSYLVSERGEDFELTLGQDISIGYESHTTEKVQLYFTESFTFRVLTPEAVRVFTHKNQIRS
jgi:uncharacterized linocin/CFP29 family protein